MAGEAAPAASRPHGFGKYTLNRSHRVGAWRRSFLARQAGLEGFEKTIVIKRIRPHLSKQMSS